MNAHVEMKDAVVVQPLPKPVPLIFSAVGNFFTGFYQDVRATLLGYMGEARSRTFNWVPELTIIGRKKHWLYPTYAHPIDGWKNGARQFRVPARRRAGFGAYKKLKQPEILKAPKPTDCAWEVFWEEVRMRYSRYDHDRFGNSVIINLDDNHYPPGTLITIAYDGIRWVDPYKERASERRARLSSTARHSIPISNKEKK